MSKVVAKGTALQEEIAAVFTDVAQLVSIDLNEAETETIESDTLDNTDAGVPYSATGRAEGGSVSGEMLLDPALTGHQLFTDKVSDPSTNLPTNYKIVFADSASTEWPFTAAGVTFGGGTVAANDLLRTSFSLKVDKLPTYPASS